MLLMIGVWLTGSLCADENQPVSREYQLKTAYLLHFAELAEWPNINLVSICLQGSSPIRNYLPILEGQQIDGRAVHVEFIERSGRENCQILFLSDNSALTIALMEDAKRNHILLVSDSENFARSGGMVQFALRDNKLKLIVNLAAVKEAGLKLSSKLLRMAEILE